MEKHILVPGKPQSMPSLPPSSPSSISSSAGDQDAMKRSLRQFAEQKSWKLVFKLTESVKIPPQPTSFHYEVKLCRVTALIKMRLFKTASEDLLTIDFTSTLIPFSLRITNAILPSFSGNHQLALDNLFHLLVWLENQALDEELMVKEKKRTQFALVSVLSMQRDFLSAIGVVNDMIKKDPSDGKLHSTLGQLYLELGDLKKAKQAFEACEEATCDDVQKKMNSGLLNFALSEYEKAAACFDDILTNHPNGRFEVAARNNKACCALFLKDLKGAVKLLKDPLFSNPKTYVDEVFVSNLSILVDLCDNPTERKNEITKLLSSHGEEISY